jgi:hypothetical protein
MNRGRKGILRTSASVLALVASGTSETASLSGRRTQRDVLVQPHVPLF